MTLTHQLPTLSNLSVTLSPPPIGEMWPGQGGIYLGLLQYADGAFHTIAAANDVPGRHIYGGDGVVGTATCRFDGQANTDLLIKQQGRHPAANAAIGFTAEGHADFFLPAIDALHHAYKIAPESFAKDCVYWSSTQSGANCALGLYFDNGWIFEDVKFGARLVRPFRRLLP
ncbi:DUF1566 domain-containing protein [Pseudomonas guariconensis]|uniref:DUF1566 domain-containing protein n=1 Tax=Pseudomonas guariconensis TaxID=1288410 RepID=UPI003906A8E4